MTGRTEVDWIMNDVTLIRFHESYGAGFGELFYQTHLTWLMKISWIGFEIFSFSGSKLIRNEILCRGACGQGLFRRKILKCHWRTKPTIEAIEGTNEDSSFEVAFKIPWVMFINFYHRRDSIDLVIHNNQICSHFAIQMPLVMPATNNQASQPYNHQYLLVFPKPPAPN